jgi:hypothetical protein
MSCTLVPRHIVSASFGVALIATVMVSGQQQAPSGQERPAEQQYKKIKVLTGTPAGSRVLSAWNACTATFGKNSTLQVLEVRENVQIDASKFKRPASKAPANPER